MGTKSELATSPLPSHGPTSGRHGPTSGRECYVPRTFSGSPTKGTKSELAAYHLPLHNRPLVSYGGKNGKTTFKTLVLELGTIATLGN